MAAIHELLEDFERVGRVAAAAVGDAGCAKLFIFGRVVLDAGCVQSGI